MLHHVHTAIGLDNRFQGDGRVGQCHEFKFLHNSVGLLLSLIIAAKLMKKNDNSKDFHAKTTPNGNRRQDMPKSSLTPISEFGPSKL
jgi:hypothetical protein